MEKLLEIAKITSSKQDFFDMGDLKIITDLLISHFELDEYIKNVDIERINPNYDTFANYYYYKKEVKLYLDNIILGSVNKYANSNLHENKVDLKRFVAIHVLQTVAHELSHGRQQMILENNSWDLEKYAIWLSMISYNLNNISNREEFIKEYLNTDDKDLIEKFIKEIKEYQMNENKGMLWETKPIEREADVRAWNIVSNIFENIDGNEFLLKYIEFQKNIRLLRGYDVKGDKVIPPIETYLDERKKILTLEPITKDTYTKIMDNVINEANFDTRIVYGFPISLEEGKTLAKKVKSMNFKF